MERERETDLRVELFADEDVSDEPSDVRSDVPDLLEVIRGKGSDNERRKALSSEDSREGGKIIERRRELTGGYFSVM